MLNALGGRCVFPPEFVSPKTKELNEYGLAYAKALYYSSNRYGGAYFYGASGYDALVELAQGRQSTTNISKLFGYYVNPNNPLNDGSGALAWIDIQVLNLVPKYVNRAVAKMKKMAYDIGLQAIDIVSNDEKATMVAAIQAYYRLKGWHQQMGVDSQDMFKEIDISTLPQFQDELMYDLTVNPKIKKEISGELTIKLLHAINRFDQKMGEVAWDLVVTGSGHVHTYLDKNGIPRADRENPKFNVGSYVDNEDFEDQEYAGFYDFITVNQFLKESDGFLSQEEQLSVIRKYSTNTPQADMFIDYRRIQNYDGLEYIPVLRFYYRSEDHRNYVAKKTDTGREYLTEQDLNYKPDFENPKYGERLAARFGKDGDSRMIENSYTSIYGGSWVIDSDCIYDYGRREYPRQKLVNASLPIKTFKTNHKEGRVVSFVSQMIEPVYMINVCWNKIKEILAQGYNGILEMDFNQIEDIAMGQGGQVWTAFDVVQFFLKKKILIKRGQTNKHDQKIGDGITVSPTGLMLDDYWNTLQQSIQMLEQMTGTSVIESANIPDRLPAKGAQLSQMASDVDMEYLYNAYEYLYERASHQLLLLAQESRMRGNTIRDFIPALGKVNSGYFDVPEDIAYCEYGMYLTRQATEAEWADFLQDVKLAVQAGLNGTPGGISLADSAYVREIDNLKQARQILGIRQQIYERKAQEQARVNQDMALESNAQAAQLKTQGALQEIQAKNDAAMELAKLQGMITAKLDEAKAKNELTMKQIEYQNKARIAKDTSTDEIIKQAVRNRPLLDKNEVEANKTIIDSVKTDRKMDIEEMKAKQKPAKPAAKK